MTQQSPAPGWYPDGTGSERWWDGNAWTDAQRPAPTTQAPTPDPRATQVATGPAGPTGPGQSPYVPGAGPGSQSPRRGKGGIIALIVVVVVLLVGGVIGITLLVTNSDGDGDGDTSSQEDNVTEEEFCTTVREAFSSVAEQGVEDGEVDTSEAVESLESTGTPEDFPDDVQAGFDLAIESFREIDGKTQDEIEDLDLADSAEGDAFVEYLNENCAAPTG